MKRESRELLAKPPLTARLREYAAENEGQVRRVLSFIVGLLCARGRVLGGFAPFGPAFLAGVDPAGLLPAYFGCVLGYLLPGSGVGALKYLIALSCVLGIRWLFGGESKLARHVAFAPVLTLAAVLAADVVARTLGRPSLYDLMRALAHGGLGAGAALFLRRTGELADRREAMENLGTVEFSCLVITLGLMVIGLSHFTVGFFSLGRALTVLFILLAAHYGRAAMGCVAGTTAGACMILAGTPYPYLMGAYSLGGLLSGCFSLFGKLGSACAFIVVSGVAALVSGRAEYTLFPLYEVLAATAVFMMLPKGLGHSLAPALSRRAAPEDGTAKDSVAMKLEFSSKTLAEISATLDRVSKKLEGKNTGDVSLVYGQAADEVCRRCGLRLFCWETAFHETMTALNSLTPTLRRDRQVTAEAVPEYFAGKCCRLGEMLGAINRNYTYFLASERAGQRIREIRAVSLEQLEGMVEMLQSLSEEVQEVAAFDLKTAGQIKRLLENKGIAYQNVAVTIDRFDRMTVEILLPGDVSFNKLNLLFRIDEVCERVFDEPTVSETREMKKLTFCEKAGMCVEFGACQHAQGDLEMCGDSYDYFLDGKGRAHLILSDGMGSGGEAAVDSAVTTGLFTKLVKAGFDYDAALKIVNCALIVKSGEESLSTIDVGCVDLYTGRAEFLKAGAAPTFLKKGGKVGRVETASLPAGILTGVEFQKTGIRLSPGDWIVMVSDGVTASGIDWVISEIQLFSQKLTPKEMARRLTEEAGKRNKELYDDDVTVVAACLKRSE